MYVSGKCKFYVVKSTFYRLFILYQTSKVTQQ